MTLNKILLFNDFINEELYKVLTDRSGSGKTRVTDTILDDPFSAKSTGSGVLLRKQLSDVEMLDTIKSTESGNHKNDKLSIVINNLKFLKHQKSILGDLYCEYCNRGPLKVYEFDYSRITNPINNRKYKNIRFNNKFSRKDGATADHRNPISNGGDLYDYSNLAVCCAYCNQRKGNMSYDSWINIISKK